MSLYKGREHARDFYKNSDDFTSRYLNGATVRQDSACASEGVPRFVYRCKTPDSVCHSTFFV